MLGLLGSSSAWLSLYGLKRTSGKSGNGRAWMGALNPPGYYQKRNADIVGH